MAKLHELLAVGTSLETQANATRAELTNTFEKKRHHFTRTEKTYIPLGEGAEPVKEEISDIQTSVGAEIKWIGEKIAKSMDVNHQIDVANTLAKADVVLEDGTTILKDVPATSLLQLEKTLKQVDALVKAIPTLDPAKGFTQHSDDPQGVYRARDIRKNRTQKVVEPLVLHPPTDKHPAQVQPITVDKVTGTILEQEWCSLIPVVTKGNILDNLEDLIRAVKKARSRANDMDFEVASHKIGKKLLDHIFAPIAQQ